MLRRTIHSGNQQEVRAGEIRDSDTGVDMQYMCDSFDAGNVVAARLSPMTLGELEPVLQRLLAGQQPFVKQADGTWRPKGFELGLARCFEFADLQAPAPRMAGC
jgi:hypothetical protein